MKEITEQSVLKTSQGFQVLFKTKEHLSCLPNQRVPLLKGIDTIKHNMNELRDNALTIWLFKKASIKARINIACLTQEEVMRAARAQRCLIRTTKSRL